MAGAAAALLLLALAGPCAAVPTLPADDQQVVARLPAVPGWRRSGTAASDPGEDAQPAVARARAYLEAARREGDARLAGLALGALHDWQAPAVDPLEVVVMQATIAQYLHDFERAERLLGLAVEREPSHAQAWLTLATVRRVRGDLRGSDEACAQLAAAGEARYGAACRAENRALRGDTGGALSEFARLLGDPAAAALRPWLLTSVAQTHVLAGQTAAAEASLRAALALGADDYSRLALADLLLAQGQAAAVPALLAAAGRSDAVLLRQALAARALGSAEAPALAAELGARLAATAERPGGEASHLRERARYALDLNDDARTALALARRNLDAQREAEDLLLFARAAAALGARDALEELGQLMNRLGVRDERIAALQ